MVCKFQLHFLFSYVYWECLKRCFPKWFLWNPQRSWWPLKENEIKNNLPSNYFGQRRGVHERFSIKKYTWHIFIVFKSIQQNVPSFAQKVVQFFVLLWDYEEEPTPPKLHNFSFIVIDNWTTELRRTIRTPCIIESSTFTLLFVTFLVTYLVHFSKFLQFLSPSFQLLVR